MTALARDAVFIGAHTGACKYRRWCRACQVRLTDNSREAIADHIRRRRAGKPDLTCRFDMVCEVGLEVRRG